MYHLCYSRVKAANAKERLMALRKNMTQKSESSFEEAILLFTHTWWGAFWELKNEVAGITLEMLVVRSEHDRMTLRVPLEKARSLA